MQLRIIFRLKEVLIPKIGRLTLGMITRNLTPLILGRSTSIDFRELFRESLFYCFSFCRVLSGEFIVVNKHLLRDLVKLGLWDTDMKNRLIAANGSVQNINEIPDNIKLLYRTAWEISQRSILDMAADRGAYICQSQSLNIFMENVTNSKLTSMHFHAWKSGLKTGMYYLRTKAAADAIKFTIDKKYKTAKDNGKAPELTPEEEVAMCSIENGDDCDMCGS